MGEVEGEVEGLKRGITVEIGVSMSGDAPGELDDAEEEDNEAERRRWYALAAPIGMGSEC